MPGQASLSEVSTSIDDARIRVFRRLITISDEADSMLVDCYTIITRRFVVVCDTLLCPDDMAVVISLLLMR